MKKLVCSFCLLLAALLTFNSLWAKSYENTGKLVEYLSQEKVNLTIAVNESKLLAKPKDEVGILYQIQLTGSKLDLIKAKLQSFYSFLNSQKKIQQELNQKIKFLQGLSIESTDMSEVQERMTKLENLYAVNLKTIELISENINLAKRYLLLLQEQARQLQIWQANTVLDARVSDLNQKIQEQNTLLQQLYQANILIQQNKLNISSEEAELKDEARLLLNNDNINLAQQRIADYLMQKRIAKANFELLKEPGLKNLQTLTEDYRDSIDQITAMLQALKKMKELLDSQNKLFQASDLLRGYMAVYSEIEKRQLSLGQELVSLKAEMEVHQQELKKEIAKRQTLSEYSFEEWPNLARQLLAMPALFYTYLKNLALKVADNYVWQESSQNYLLWGSLTLMVVVFLIVNRFLNRLTAASTTSRLSGYLYYGILTVFKRNLLHLSLLAALYLCFFWTQIPHANTALLFDLYFIWLASRALIMIAHILLMERLSDHSGDDVKLYHRLRWLLIAGGWSTALLVFSIQLPMSLIAQDLFNRIFMIFILAISVVIWKSKEVVGLLIRPMFRSRKRYLRTAVALLVILIPITLFSTAIIGLIGFVNLAWTMSGYQAYVVLLIIGFILIRGLLIDALDYLSEWMIANLADGWLWIEVFLKPLDKIIRLVLLLLSLYLLLSIFGLTSDYHLRANLITMLNYPVVNFSGFYITSLSMIEFLVLLSIFVWTAKWTKEFFYRWVFRKTRDLGLRHSMAVFAQYLVVLIGSLITLRVLGVDFTGMAVVLGGLAVGMGFGLRDFASNIVGGLMLLIERPVREGDLVSIGGYEGKVSHIGIRSMRVSSWDNMEVLIPNAETFNKPFTNWTHQDSIVRTTMPIKVSRQDDPEEVQQLITEVLAIIPEVLAEPEPQVFLKQIDAALLEFEVRIFVNVQLHSLFEVKSKALFAIAAQFKAAGIRAPIPPMQVELKEERHAAIFIGNKPAEE